MTADAARAAPVLVAEDDAQLREIIRQVLEDEGFRVDTAADGRRATAQLVRRRPALVVLDWGLPRLDGAGVSAVLRATHGDAVPLVLVTADGRSVEKAAAVGAVDFLEKPFDLDELVALVRRVLG
jgi:DNA-binding response OmpR family regulator